MTKIGNAFALSMVDVPCQIDVKSLNADQVRNFAPFESCLGHKDIAAIVSSIIGIEIPFARINVKLVSGEKMIVAQYIGPKLPEGVKELPAGSRIEFRLVEIL